ncbi:GIY-YIG nuclease family protein [Agrobacterium vitis]|uniref:GIY-YIG nuclease family protein n=1 Tax=Agrobacterium vitis TaxID=373 RepID=UPI0015D9915F|nr:GIY-YIG nuclease family protein [Agrobacterium vitis]MCF1451333.1 GIY-YIG nuclease family protein [Agrobacterium vitis]
MSRGQSLELFFIDGKPDGMLTAEVFNWTGHVLVVPRTQIVQALERKESRYTGVYLLLGEIDGEAYGYVGEGEDISDRIKMHDSKKDWWDLAVFVVASANTLNKAHVKYLEARLIEEARAVGRLRLENATTPSRPSLSEAAMANMEGFLDYLLMVLPAVRVDSFLQKKRPVISNPIAKLIEHPRFELVLKKENIRATAILADGEFIVEAGSMARKEWVGDKAYNEHYWRLFDDLVQNGTLEDCITHRKFKENFAFTSTSAAGAIVTGRSTAGPREWKVVNSDKTYRDWEIDTLLS